MDAETRREFRHEEAFHSLTTRFGFEEMERSWSMLSECQ